MTTKKLNSPLGELTLYADDGVLVGLYFNDDAGKRPLPEGASSGDHALLERTSQQLCEYFAGKRHVFDVPVAPRGTDFQRKVWRLLCAIPFGETRAYADLACELGDKNLVRAVGQANGQNPIAIVIPCHRVIGKDGSMTGFASGIARKVQLLALEAKQQSLFG